MTHPALAMQYLDRDELIALLNERNQQHEEEVQGLQHQLKGLHEQLEWLKKQLFGKKSERFVPDSGEQPPLPGIEADASPTEENSSTTIQAHTRKKRRCKGVDAMSWPDNTPVRETILDYSGREKLDRRDH